MDKKDFIQLDFANTSVGQNELLIALLANIGYTGFEEGNISLKAFIPQVDFNKEELDAVLLTIPATYTKSIIEDENWNAKWESSFKPIVVNDFVRRTPWVAIRAGFHQPVTSVKHEIIITPKMSFGTGHHATTYLMIEQMGRIDFTAKAVLDFGTGTGILAILSEKMGASEINAIDNDDWSITNAIENITANDCKRIIIENAARIPTEKEFDIILANINLNVIKDCLGAISHACKKGAVVLLSGFLLKDEISILRELVKNGFKHLATSQKGGWICLQVQKD